MGCDYYIVKILEVKYLIDNKNGVMHNIELDREKCYFNEIDSKDSDDTDDEDYHDKFNRKYSKYLEVHYKPRVLFINNNWKNEKTKEKYEDFVLNEIKNGMIISVIKKEIRYLR